jgi:DNA-binding NarL/FixJ family response regulator
MNLNGKRVLVVADALDDARGVARVLSDSEAFRVTGSALSRGIDNLRVDALDLIVVQSDDRSVARMVSARHPGIPVLELGPPTEGARRSSGTHALLSDRAGPAEIRAAAMALAAGLAIRMRPEPPGLAAESEFNFLEPLTERELEVLNLLAEGLSNPVIAKQLGVSRNTVKFHVSSIIQKLGATSRTEAVTLGLKRGLVLV